MRDAFFFDLDDTLYDEETYVSSGFMEVAGFLSELVPNSPSSTEIHEMLMLILKESGRGKVFDTILNQFGIANEGLVHTLLYIYRTHSPIDLVIPDELQLIIRDLQNFGVTTGIITDGTHVTQNQKLNRLRPQIKWDVQVCTDVLGVKNWKPSKTPFIVARNLIRNEIKRWFYLGDNENKDFAGAAKAGFTTLWWNPDHRVLSDNLVAPDYQITTYSELSQFILNKGIISDEPPPK